VSGLPVQTGQSAQLGIAQVTGLPVQVGSAPAGNAFTVMVAVAFLHGATPPIAALIENTTSFAAAAA
jgi:hypothetical protein